jgi:hypothetical protein
VLEESLEQDVSRKEKRIDCITAISMTSDVSIPRLVIHRKIITVAIWEEG